ncbi:DUF6090 family protein [Winogradskyella sp.]|uniref:DUF6090 family protein n=1 Tax=Winogradskyella sp. TaxID=1883156 RepID=UPI0025D4A25D|nr:DUF6090 family protein [Winogradskyella sp.]
MIKFFRRFRQQLLSDNKFSKYFIYAIGEIVLVVIGILIALQLNNYNEILNENNLEKKAINNLKLDFHYNQAELEKSIGELKETRKACYLILDQTGNKHQDSFIIDSLLQLVPSIPQYFPQNGFLMDLISSGKLGIIENDNLRNKLSSWLPTLETIKDREKSAERFSNDIVRYIIKKGSWLNSDEVGSDEEITVLKMPKSGFEIDNNNLLKNIEFENMIENQIVYLSLLFNRQGICLELNKEIIKLLETEITKDEP